MLAIDRHEGEGIQIGDNIVIKIMKTKGRTKVGISAPKNLRIVRLDHNGKEEPKTKQ